MKADSISTVFVVQMHEAWENPQLLEIFLKESDATAYCQKMNREADECGGNEYYNVKEWEVV